MSDLSHIGFAIQNVGITGINSGISGLGSPCSYNSTKNALLEELNHTMLLCLLIKYKTTLLCKEA